jgi:hypothetical protein
MGYVGNQTTNAYTSITKQDITGNGGTAYTLDHAVANANEIEVFVNNVRQEPSVAYTVSGSALTMTGNVAASDDFYVVFQGKAVQTVVPPDDSVTTARINDGAVTNAKIDTMAATKLTGTIDRARLPSVVAFSAKSGAGNTTQNSVVLPFTIENFDIGGNYDTTNKRFTAPVAGIYHFDCTIHSSSSQASAAWIRKNGTNYLRGFHASSSGGYEGQLVINVNMKLAANDYVDIYSPASYQFYLVDGYNEFSGFLIGQE